MAKIIEMEACEFVGECPYCHKQVAEENITSPTFKCEWCGKELIMSCSI